MRPVSPVVPYLWLDGIVMKVRVAGRYENVSSPVAIGVNREGYREVSGVAPGFSEDKGSWLSFLRWLKEKGLEYVGLAVSDAHPGVREALAECFPRACWQLHRPLLSQYPLPLPQEDAGGSRSFPKDHRKPGKRSRGPGQGGEGGGKPAQAPSRGLLRAFRRAGGDAHLLLLSTQALAPYPLQQSHRKALPRGAQALPGGRGLPRCHLLPDARLRQAEMD